MEVSLGIHGTAARTPGTLFGQSSFTGRSMGRIGLSDWGLVDPVRFRITFIVTSEFYWNCDTSMLAQAPQTGFHRRR